MLFTSFFIFFFLPCFHSEIMRDIKVWPYPVFFENNANGTSVRIHNMKYNLFDKKTGKFIEEDNYIESLFHRYKEIVLKHSNSECGKEVKNVEMDFHIVVEDISKRDLTYGINETYSLKIDDKAVELYAVNIFGVVRAMETFAQVTTDGVIEELPISIVDYPRYPWRGLLLEICNHYLTKQTVLKVLDGMAFNKLNIFHFHFIDSASFPFIVEKYPLLSEKGSYDAKRAVYSREDMKEIVDYAYMRGIIVMPEFEAPGHGYSWGLGYPETVPKCPSITDIQDIPLNPIEPLTMDISRAILDDLFELFDFEYYHFGGDEIVFECWEEDEAISKYMKDHGLSPRDLERVFMQPIYDYSKGKIPIHWQERFDEESKYPVPENSVLQIWKNASDLTHYIKKGYPIINSGGWYIDRMQPVPPSIRYAMLDVWRDMYFLEMNDFIPKEDRHLIMGGEVAMWSEQINDFMVEPRMWPKACAPAERLWTKEGVVLPNGGAKNDDEDNDLLTKRLMHHLCRNLIKRGINASPIQPDYCPPE